MRPLLSQTRIYYRGKVDPHTCSIIYSEASFSLKAFLNNTFVVILCAKIILYIIINTVNSSLIKSFITLLLLLRYAIATKLIQLITNVVTAVV